MKSNTNDTQTVHISFMNTADKVIANYEKGADKKVTSSTAQMFVAAIMAGMFIAFGASSSSVAAFGIDNVGLARTVAGTVFPIGLMLIVLVGGELFTGDGLMIVGVMSKRYKVSQMVKTLVIVYFGNLVGSLLIAGLLSCSGQWNYGGGALAAYTIKVAVGKTGLSWGTALSSGILCNILVCAAVLMAGAAKDATGKIWSCFFPIFAFVIAGFEHCVANMYYIAAGIIAAMNPDYVKQAMQTYGCAKDGIDALGWGSMITNNLIPVTIGNLIGGMVFVGVPMFFLTHHKNS